MPALREILAKFGFDVDNAKLVKAVSSVDNFATKVKTLAEKVMGGDVKEAFKDWTADVKEQSGEIRKLAARLGIGVAEAQRWTNAANFAGVGAEQMNAAMLVLNKTIAAAASGAEDAGGALEAVGDGSLETVLGGKKAAEIFKSLGVEVKDAKGEMKSTTQIMGDVGLAIAKIDNPAQRSATAMKVFGRQGATLIPLFSKGEKGLQEFLDKIDELGGGISEKTIQAMKDNAGATKEYDAAMLGLKSEVVGAVIPALTAKAKALAKVVAWFRTTIKNTNIVKSSVEVLGAAMLIMSRNSIIAGARAALAWLPMVLAITALILLLDDLQTYAQGGDSAFGKLVKTIAEWESELLGGTKEEGDEIADQIQRAVKNGTLLTELADAIGVIWNGMGVILSFALASEIQDIEDWANDLLQSGKDAAGGLIDGLVNGIHNGINTVGNAIADLGKTVVDKMRSIFDWHSPSGLTEDLGFGGLDMGLVKGLAKGVPMIEAQADKTFGAAIPDFSTQVRPSAGAIAGAQGAGTTTIDQRNNIQQTFQVPPGQEGLRDTVRLATGEGLGDLRASLTALEAQG